MNFDTKIKSANLAKVFQQTLYLKNGGAFMAQNKLLNMSEDNTREDKNSQVINSSTKASSNSNTGAVTANTVKVKLKEIQDSYQSKMPSVDWSQYQDELKPKEYTGQTDEEIQQQAENGLSNFKEKSINKILTNFDKDNGEIKADKNDASNEYSTEISSANKSAFVNNESLNKQAISKGIERSSIISNEKQNIVDKKIIDINSAKKEYENTLSALELKQNVIEANKDLALENFDIAYASKLTTNINKLKTEASKLEAEIEDYNSQIKARKAEIQTEFDKKNATKIENINNEMQRDMAMETFTLLKSLPKDTAKQIMQDAEISKSLGDWYSILSVWLRDYK